MTARYVKHDDYTWRVDEEYPEDGEQWFHLSRRVPGHKPLIVLCARVADCQPVTPERKRRFKDSHGIIEFNSRGEVTLREPGRRKRYATTILGLIHLCARQESMNQRREKVFKQRGRR